MKKQIPQYILDNPEKYIPKGSYCYDSNGLCPFWDIDETKSIQENGYCHYLKQGDWELNPIYNKNSKISFSRNEEEIGKSVAEVIGEHFPTSLLWDQVKECGINDEEGDVYDNKKR